MDTRRRLTAGRAVALALVLSALASGICSCAAYLLPRGGTRTLVDARGPEAALKRIAPLRKGGSRLLYLYERGLILHELGRHAESNAALDDAHERHEDLYTKSLSREIVSLATSDELVEYRGADFEATIVHYYRIMNFLRMGDVEGATVECRRLSRELQRCRDRGNAAYGDDPFLEYVTGVVYALARERADADVSLRAAKRGYERPAGRHAAAPPPGLDCDLLENAAALGDRAESDEEAGALDCGGLDRGGGLGRVYLFLEYGSVPAKVERSIAIPVYRDDAAVRSDRERYAAELRGRCGVEADPRRALEDLWLISLPALEETAPAAGGARVRAAGVADSLPPGAAPVTANLAALSRRAFEQDYDRVVARAIARALAKHAAREAARPEEEDGKERKKKQKPEQQEDQGPKTVEKPKPKPRPEPKPEKTSSPWYAWLFGWTVALFTAATERADVRCWSTLPGQILTARLDLPEGRHTLEVSVVDRAGSPLGVWTVPEVRVAAGEIRVLSHRVR